MDPLPKNFDYLFYSYYYSDLKNAFGIDKFQLEQHYINYGRFENRKYCSQLVNFDLVKYVQDNPELFNEPNKIYKDNIITTYLNTKNVNYKNNYYSSQENNCKLIYIVYYCALNTKKDWRSMINEQLYDIVKTGILKISKLHIVVYGSKTDIQDLKNMLVQNYNIEFDTTEIYENLYEFPAIIKIRELAVENPNMIFIYLHSKNMFNHNPSPNRTILEMKLTNFTFLDWESTLSVFMVNSKIQKAMLSPSETGWGWFNFWWARGSYLVSCKPIEIPTNLTEPDRFKCEVWLGEMGSQTWEDCYSIIKKEITTTDDVGNDVWKIK